MVFSCSSSLLTNKVFLFLLFTSLLHFCVSLLSSDVKWTNELILKTGFEIRWDASDQDFLIMEISAPTMGYVAVGFSPNGDMLGSDIVACWVDSEGIPHIKDLHGVGNNVEEDFQKDYYLIASAERDNQTIIRFHRRWETCDELDDISIGNDTMKLIWAWHNEDPFSTSPEGPVKFSWHGAENRGFVNVHMRLPNSPIPYPDGSNGLETLPPNINIWDLTLENVDIDGSENSLFMCKLFHFPNYLGVKRSLIGFRPLITEENEGNIHRILVHQCQIPTSVIEKFKTGRLHQQECYNSQEKDEMENSWMKYCNELLLAWDLGSEGQMFPEHVGQLFLDSKPTIYFKLQVHYDNLAGKQFLDSSGIRLFHTEETRMFSGGILSQGHKVTPFLAVPPSQEHFRIYSVCSSDCTRNGIPDSGINIFSVTLHAHETGRKIRLRHIRNGKELFPIAEDNNYTYQYQQHRIMKNEVRIFPGDELLLECEYNTMHRDKFTFGGYKNEEEICQALLHYYPKGNLNLCQSKPEFQSFFSGFGIKSTMGDGLMRLDNHSQREGADLLPPQFVLEQWPSAEEPFDKIFITNPFSLFNMSVAERMNNFDWRLKHVAKNLENSWRNGRHYMYCEGTTEIPYKKYVAELPKYHKHKKISTSICRKPRHRNSGEIKTMTEEPFLIAFAFLLNIALCRIVHCQQTYYY